MKETTEHLQNILDILHVARKKNKKIGARLKHFIANKETWKVQLTGKGWVSIDAPFVLKGAKEMTKEEILKVADSWEMK